MTTDKWTSEIDLSFGIKLAESQLCNLSEIDLSLLQIFIQKQLFLDIVWFKFGSWLVYMLFDHIFFTHTQFNN